MNKMIWRVGGLALAAALSACGGGGADAGCSVFSTSCTTTGTGTTTVSTTSDSGTVSTSSSGTVVLSLSSTTISASTPGTVTALVKNASGTPLANTLVTFTVANGAAKVSPERVTTDAQGNASATLQPVAGAIGADYVSAAADVSTTSTLTTRTTFTVSAVNVALSSADASPPSISAYGASVITVNVTGASSASPVTVNFSSTCASAGKAVLSPTSITVTGTSASTTYQDKACASADRISATITGTSQQKQVDLAVAAPIAQALEFVSATPEKICLAGSGCEMSSVVSFRLKDQYNNPVSGREVTFSLDIPNVAVISPATYKTNELGLAQVSVTAKTIPSPVRVRADVTLDNGTKLSTVSNVLAINAGLPTQKAFSFSASKYAMIGNLDGDEANIRIQLNDRFANPVPDGTSISFVAEGASVIPAHCTTVKAVCNVKFVVSNYRPPDGRVTVLAYAQGEESFIDANKDNVYTVGEDFEDLGPLFIDKDENKKMADKDEYLIGENANGKWDANTYVRGSEIFVLSLATVRPRIFNVVTDSNGLSICGNTDLGVSPGFLFQPQPITSQCKVQQKICIRDGNSAADDLGGNPIPSGATLLVQTNAKGVDVKVDNPTIASNVISPTMHTLSVSLSDCTKPLESSGALELKITMPKSEAYQIDLGTIK
ncbi:MAG: hypothetical protein RL260_562 [Pseudomonadota bacterium]